MENSDDILAETIDNPDAAPSYDENTEEPPGLNSESTVYYTVKKGDTLWDLSQRFDNSAWRWPGLWSKNKELTNPHRIFPGQKIKLFYRSDMERLRKLQEKMAMEKDTQTHENVDVVEPDEMDKDVDSVEPVEISDTAEAPKDTESQIQLPYYYYSRIGSIGFMRDKPAESHGEIFKVKGSEKLMIGQGDEIFIKEENGKALIPGAKYFTYEMIPTDKVKARIREKALMFDTEDKASHVRVGNQHRITGIVQISAKKSGYWVGKVIQSYRTIYLGHQLTPYVFRSPEVTLSASIEGLSGRIICSEEDEGLFGDDKVAFIDRGASDGVQVGQMYNIYYAEEKGSPELIGGKKLFVPIDFASLLVLHTEDKTSTVLITSAYQGVSAGDTWHYPQD